MDVVLLVALLVIANRFTVDVNLTIASKEK